jgi:hypothetical protein
MIENEARANTAQSESEGIWVVGCCVVVVKREREREREWEWDPGLPLSS